MKRTYKPGWRSKESRQSHGFVKRMMLWNLKVALPIAIACVLALIFLWPKVAKFIEDSGKPQTMERILSTNPQLENKLIGPKLESTDQKGRPFRVQAEYATNVNEENSDFVNPSGQMQLEDGSILSFTSKTGIYHKKEELLELFDDVNVKTDKGYDLKTRYMKIFLNENKGEGHEPVHGTGPTGETIDAEGFRITDKGDIIDFLGKTKITLPGVG